MKHGNVSKHSQEEKVGVKYCKKRASRVKQKSSFFYRSIFLLILETNTVTAEFFPRMVIMTTSKQKKAIIPWPTRNSKMITFFITGKIIQPF